MSIDIVMDRLKESASSAAPLGASFLMVVDDHPIHIDGTGDSNVISEENKPADCTMTTSVDTLAKMKSGELNPMMAFMSGEIKLEGNMMLATKLQSLLG